MKLKAGLPAVVPVGPFQNPDNTFPDGPLAAGSCLVSLNGGAFASKNDAGDAVADHVGMYLVPLDSHDTERTGYGVLVATLPGGMTRRVDFEIV